MSQALPVLRAHGARYYLLDPLRDKAEILYAESKFEEAREQNLEVLALAIELNHEEIVLQSHVLAAKIDFALGDQDGGRRQLEHWLAEFQDSAEQAALHYELWKMGHDALHSQTAVDLYRHLYRTKPYFEYKLRLEELLPGQTKKAITK